MSERWAGQYDIIRERLHRGTIYATDLESCLDELDRLRAEVERLRGEREEAEIRLADLAGAGRELLAAQWVRAWEECADYLDKMIGEPVPHGYRPLAEFAAREARRRLAEEDPHAR